MGTSFNLPSAALHHAKHNKIARGSSTVRDGGRKYAPANIRFVRFNGLSIEHKIILSHRGPDSVAEVPRRPVIA